MTCREKMAIEHPGGVDNECLGGCAGCPHTYGYAQRPEWCKPIDETCMKCWDREVEETKGDDEKMTCREKLMREHPEELDIKYFGGCNSCPALYGYADKPKWCKPSEENCTKCWDREVETDVRTNKDSLDRTETKTEEKSYKELLQEAQLFADDIVAAAGMDFLLTIAEAQSKFIFELLRMMKRKRGH